MEKRNATYGESILALLFMFVFVFVGFLAFGLRVELMMVAAAGCAGILARRLGYSWSDLEKAISSRIAGATPAILIIWVIGIVISTFIFSGSIPMLIFYGIDIVTPQYLLVSAFLLCVVFSTITGTSWGSAGTAGLACMSIAAGFGVPLHITAAAVICGSIFGDKMSPLSETTNLAAATTGVNLYDHIKSMMWTTIPAALITLSFFYIVGLNLDINGQGVPVDALAMQAGLGEMFNWSPLLLLPFIIILAGAIMKKPPVPTMLIGILSAIAIGVLYQGFTLESGIYASLRGFNVSMVPEVDTANLADSVLTLLNRGGIVSMAGVVIIIYCGYAYTAIISKAGFLETAIAPLADRVKQRGPLMITTLFTGLILLVFSGTSYTVAIMLPEMFKKQFLKAGMAARTLSRSIEDVGTMVAALVPWGTSGAFYISTLGVPIYGAGGYGIWAVMTYLTPIIAIILAFAGIGVYKLSKEEAEEAIIKSEQKAI
ncbi:transporter (NhaC family) [Cytobacillus oceanisediminis]|uniref:Transporter (NhaC family) n=1 Tax=Cytobacillus oceanisediminis TaxID=665099 RepID=A0A2V3A5Q1_9BACI|nr:Na+/H+ antiporter NhaC [Cytobacillus oceanisediminis]PWW32209.1 transporter (NhaC family) [Cytobacillus oceanisediminis]